MGVLCQRCVFVRFGSIVRAMCADLTSSVFLDSRDVYTMYVHISFFRALINFPLPHGMKNGLTLLLHSGNGNRVKMMSTTVIVLVVE